jgi:hypothetical protein
VSARVSSELLLVGSLPAPSTEEALRAGGELFGDLVFALPDGETGIRAMWTGYEHLTLVEPNPGLEVVEQGQMPPRHVGEITVMGVRDGVDALQFETWPRIDDAIASYEIFRALRDEGVIPAHVRFQVSMPFPTSSVGVSLRRSWSHDFPIVAAAMEDLVAREIKRLTAAIPPEDLAIQWDVCWEVLDLEGVVWWMDDDGWDRFAGPTSRMTQLIPEEALVGYHLCYGTFPTWPMYEARDMGLMVKMANYAIESSGRLVDFLHMAGPRDMRSQDSRYFAPLADLRAPDTRVYLGIVLPIDGVQGLRRRHATASQCLDDFGIAMYCGFGRQPGEDGMETMREHRRVVEAVVGAADGA